MLQGKKPSSTFYRGSLFLIIWISFKISASFLKLCIDHKHDYITSNLVPRLLPMTLHHHHPDQCPFLWLWLTPVFAFFSRIYRVKLIVQCILFFKLLINMELVDIFRIAAFVTAKHIQRFLLLFWTHIRYKNYLKKEWKGITEVFKVMLSQLCF